MDLTDAARGGTGRRGTARRRTRGTRSGPGRTGVGELKRRRDGGWVGYARLERRGVPRERHLGAIPSAPVGVWHAPAEINYPRPPFGTTRRGTVRRLETRAPPDSMDAPTDRGRCRMLRARALVQSDAGGVDPRATKSFESEKRTVREPNGPRDATTWTEVGLLARLFPSSDRPPRGAELSDTPVAPMSARRLSSSPPAASVRLAGSAHHRRDHHGDRSRARQVRRHRRRPGRHHRRCVVAPRPDRSSRSIVIVFLARTVLASTSPPARVASAPPTDARSPPPLSQLPPQALWTRCPPPARTSRWTR